MSVLSSNVLVLNKSYFPIHITTVKRAFSLLLSGKAKAVDKDFNAYDFKSWMEASAYKDKYDVLRLVNHTIRIPRVIVLQTYNKIPPRKVKFNRYNIFLRDKNTCQYCGRTFPRSELNIDHVIPKSKGGKTEWENVVCCCLSCNRKKGGKTPEEAGMKLLRKPETPRWHFVHFLPGAKRYEEWAPFLKVIDVAYWSVELEQDS